MNNISASTPAAAASLPASPATEAFAVRVGYIWLMVLAPVAGFVVGMLSLFAGAATVGLLLALALLATGYWAWRRGYRAVRLVLAPEHLRVLPAAPGLPAEDIPLRSIAGYLQPQETYYQLLELWLHGGSRLRFSKRLRKPPGGALTFDAWTEVLADHLEQARPAVAAEPTAVAEPASGLVAGSPRVFARTTMGKVLAGLAIGWLLLVGLAALGGAHLPTALFLAPTLYLGYYFRARGVLKVQTRVLTGIEADRDNWRNND